ncbi:hypothetical protein AB7M29_004138 [Pseudomonas sp. F-14 TE3623]|jgi:hypothetical protein
MKLDLSRRISRTANANAQLFNLSLSWVADNAQREQMLMRIPSRLYGFQLDN